MLTVAQAHGLILQSATVCEAETVPLADGCGRVLATDVIAQRALPGWDNSAMDGYAVHHADLKVSGVSLPVADAIPAESGEDRPLLRGTAARIFTGAPLPSGADAVVIQENTQRVGSLIQFDSSTAQWANVRRRGSDVKREQVVLKAGRCLTPGDLSLLASLGVSHPEVVRRPIVHIAVTGNELVDMEGPAPRRGQIVDGNGLALAAAVRQLGAIPRVLPRIPDDRAATLKAISEGMGGADILLTAGGASVGDHDHIGPAFRTLAGDGFAFAKVAVRPGKPIIHGRLDGCAFFGLPGNPVSALVTFEVFVRPALLKMMGHLNYFKPVRHAVLQHAMRAGGARQEYRRASVCSREGRLYVDGRRSQSSGAVSSLGGADAFIIVPPGASARAAGEVVDVLMIGPDCPSERGC